MVQWVDTTTATLEPGDPPLRNECDFGNRAAENGVWYRYTATRAINLELATLGSDYDTIAVAYTGTCGALTEIFCNDDDFDENRIYGEDSRLLVTLAAGEEVHLLVADAGGRGGGALGLDVTESPMFQASLHDSAAATEDAKFPSVAADDSGDFIVVWAGSSPNEVRGRLFDRKGRAKQAACVPRMVAVSVLAQHAQEGLAVTRELARADAGDGQEAGLVDRALGRHAREHRVVENDVRGHALGVGERAAQRP
jgi:hypothetical protein